MDLDLDLLPDAVLLLSGDGAVLGLNAAAQDLLGPIGDRYGRPVAEAFGVRDAMGAPTLDDGFPDAGREVELTFTHADGAEIPLMITARVTDDRVLLCARPVSDRSGIAIVSTVSHELRSPLTSVKGYVSLMLNRWDRIDDVRKREMLTQVHNDADRVTRMITELLDISRLETGRLVLRRQLVDLGALSRTVVEKVHMALPELDCAVAVAGEIPEVYADPDKLEQVLTNLVENAAKYGSPAGMEVRVTPVGNSVSVAVTDRGEGIPAEDLPKLFNKFFRRDFGRPTGTGLGLWISRGLVEAHGGELVAESVLGEGTTFTFTVPVGDHEHPGA